MASASRDMMTRIYDIRAMKELYSLKGHKDGITSEFKRGSHSKVMIFSLSKISIPFLPSSRLPPNSPLIDRNGKFRWSFASLVPSICYSRRTSSCE